MTHDQAAVEDRIDAEDDNTSTGEGILRCLQMLAEEAATLRLPHTVDALHGAIAACMVESMELTDHRPVLAGIERRAGARLH